MALLALLAAIPCCSSGSYPVYSPAGVREEAGKALACDPLIVKFDQEPPGYRDYVARGCGRTVRLMCTEDPQGVVQCRTDDLNLGSAEGDGDGATDDSDSGGCGCGHLFHGKHKASDPPNESNPTSTTPQRTKR